MENKSLKYCGLAFLNLESMNNQYNTCHSRKKESTTTGEDNFASRIYEPSISVAQGSHLASAIHLYNMLMMQEKVPHNASLSEVDMRRGSMSVTSRNRSSLPMVPVRSQSCSGRFELCVDPARNTTTWSEQFPLGFSFVPLSMQNEQPPIHMDSPSAVAIVGLEVLFNTPSDNLPDDDCDSLSTTSTKDYY
jgi:hypothetical protein